MMFHKNRPRFDSGPYTHHLAPFADVNGGGMEFVFDSGLANPLFSFRGPARLAGEWKVVASGGEPVISLHPIGALQGQPFINGMYHIQDSQEVNKEFVRQF